MLLFSDVAVVFEEIEKRSGRLEMTDVLAALFKQTSANEIGQLIYILQGILAPPYDGIDLGMGERFALEAIASASGYTKSQVENEFKKSGDLGDTAQKLLEKKKQTALLTSEMGVVYVFDAFVRIAKASGPGSQDQKIKILTELLNNSSPLEARYIVRFVIGSLRLGVGDPTIIDAISVAHAGDKSLREPLERAYNVCSDLGYVARSFYKDPKSIAHAFAVQPFKPLMPALAEREDSPAAIMERLGKCGVEMKYDGLRLQCHKKGDRIEIYSRKLERMTHMFPDIVAAIRDLKPKEIIFEGEALAFDEKNNRFMPFQQTMHRRRKHGIDEASKEFPLNLFVFDLLYLDGKDMTNEPYKKRRAEIMLIFKVPKIKKAKSPGKATAKKSVKTSSAKTNASKTITPKTLATGPTNILIPSEMKLMAKRKDLEKLFNNAIAKGLEGIIAKDLSAPYTAGKRKFAWIKLKKSYGQSVDTLDVVIVGYFLGQGARADFEFGGLLAAVYNPERGKLETIARVGSGFSEEEMKSLKEMLEKIKTAAPPTVLDYNEAVKPDFWVEPKYVVEVAFDDITESQLHTCGVRRGGGVRSGEGSGRPGSGDEKGLALRFPRMVRFREDKTIKEATTTEEVEEMYRLQHPQVQRK